MKSLKFYKCKKCNDVIVKLVKNGDDSSQGMEEIIANTTDAATEKHLPVAKLENGFVEVTVGSISHPMEEAHYINFIAVETNNGYHIVSLEPSNKPEAKIYVGNSKVIAVYEYCNLHGLWKINF